MTLFTLLLLLGNYLQLQGQWITFGFTQGTVHLNVSFTGFTLFCMFTSSTCARYLIFLNHICTGTKICVKDTKTMFYLKKQLLSCLLEAVWFDSYTCTICCSFSSCAKFPYPFIFLSSSQFCLYQNWDMPK